MPRAVVKLSPVHEEPPGWWKAEWTKRQNRARNSAVRRLKHAGRALSQAEVANIGGAYGGPEMRHALDTLVASGVVRRFVRREPRTSAFKVSLGAVSEIVERTYYELTEQAR
jgi:hypothetical protein